jgi:hypothetical protein
VQRQAVRLSLTIHDSICRHVHQRWHTNAEPSTHAQFIVILDEEDFGVPSQRRFPKTAPEKRQKTSQRQQPAACAPPQMCRLFRFYDSIAVNLIS